MLFSDQCWQVFFSSMITISVRGTRSFMILKSLVALPRSWWKRWYGVHHGYILYTIPNSITICIYHANFLRFFNCCVSNTNTLHVLITWKNNKHTICAETEMKQFGVIDSLGKANDQFKHSQSLRWNIDISTVA